MPMTRVGAIVGDKPNFLAVAWGTQVNYKPPMIAVALGKTHHTNPGIHAAKAFSVNIPGVDLMEKTRTCRSPSPTYAAYVAAANPTTIRLRCL